MKRVTHELQVAVDIGCHRHRVAIGLCDGRCVEEFDIEHTGQGLRDFFARIERQAHRRQLPVSVAMEGFNGWARPLDRQVLLRGWRLFNVNNLKLARYKEIFPGAAKSDVIDTRKMLELFQLRQYLPVAKDALQEVAPVPVVNQKLKRLTRRRRQLIKEKVVILNRMQADLQAVCPGLLAITGQADNLWFLRFLACRDELTRLARLHPATLLKIPGIGKKYASVIHAWQREVYFSDEVQWAGPMIVDDARGLLALIEKIKALETAMRALCVDSAIATRIDSIPGFGETSSAELAGEIGTLERFGKEASLALYSGMANLEHSSGDYKGAKSPRQVNKRAKAAMMVAVVRHMACVPESRAYYDKKRAQGKTHNQAVRALGRHLIRIIWSMLKHDRDYQLRSKLQQAA